MERQGLPGGRGFARISPVSRFSIPHEAGSGSRSASLFCEKAERLIDEGVGVLEDATMARIREDAELRIGKGFE